MEQEFARATQIDPRFDPLVEPEGQAPAARWAKDDKLHIRFYRRAVVNPSKSTEAGRSVCDEVDYVTIHTPGSQLSVIDSPVKGTKYEKRFASQYNAWLSNQDSITSGTPLEAFPFLVGKVGLLAELKYLNIHTVEQLASVPDNLIQNMMGGFGLRKQAETWLDSTKGVDASIAKLADENAKLKARLDAMERPPEFLQQSKPAPAPAKKA